MSKIITLKNGSSSCEISTLGAELRSYIVDGKERIWQGAEGFWAGRSPILFPVCGRLLNGFYTCDGKRYDMRAHGFIKASEFEVVNEEQSTATFLYESNVESLKLYPYNFKFRVMYKLTGESLKIYFIVENHSNEKMYYSVGCHEGYTISSDLKDYYLTFDGGEEEISTTVMANNFTTPNKEMVKLSKNGLKLSDYFREDNNGDSVVIENIKSKRVSLVKDGEEELSVYFNDFKHLVLWTQYGAKFFAIEPWNGLPDAFDTNNDLKTKLAIETLEPGESKTLYHSITAY